MPPGLGRRRLPEGWGRPLLIGVLVVVVVPFAIGVIVVAVFIGAAAWELYTPGLLDEVRHVEETTGTYTVTVFDDAQVAVPLRTCDPSVPAGALIAEGRTDPGASPQTAIRIHAEAEPGDDGRAVRNRMRARNGGTIAVTMDARPVLDPAGDGVDARLVGLAASRDDSDPDLLGALRCEPPR